MIRAYSAGKLNVKGNNMLRVAVTPIPGIIPIKVPSRQPNRQYANPCKENTVSTPMRMPSIMRRLLKINCHGNNHQHDTKDRGYKTRTYVGQSHERQCARSKEKY